MGWPAMSLCPVWAARGAGGGVHSSPHRLYSETTWGQCKVLETNLFRPHPAVLSQVPCTCPYHAVVPLLPL